MSDEVDLTPPLRRHPSPARRGYWVAAQIGVEVVMGSEAEQLAAIARQWVEVGWQRGDAEAVYAMYAPGFVDLGAAEGRAATREGNVEGIVALYRAFPDFYATVADVIVDAGAGKVVVRWSATGTHQGEFMGIAATGKRVEFRGIEALRVEGDVIVERAGEWDGTAILEQLGRCSCE
jgi:steroid delta-isomerase-like uncharacterized protein